MTQTKSPPKPRSRPKPRPNGQAATAHVMTSEERNKHFPQDIEAAPEPSGQLGVISSSLDEVDNYINRITNLTKNISTRLFGSLAEAPKPAVELPEGELYITPVRLVGIQDGLREVETILDDTYNKL